MGSAASGRTITANRASDQINDRLGDLRDELREALADENKSLTALNHAQSTLAHVETVTRAANQRVRRCSARLALWQKELGDRGIVIDELEDHEIIRVDGISHRLPIKRAESPIGNAGAVGAFHDSIRASAKARKSAG